MTRPVVVQAREIRRLREVIATYEERQRAVTDAVRSWLSGDTRSPHDMVEEVLAVLSEEQNP